MNATAPVYVRGLLFVRKLSSYSKGIPLWNFLPCCSRKFSCTVSTKALFCFQYVKNIHTQACPHSPSLCKHHLIHYTFSIGEWLLVVLFLLFLLIIPPSAYIKVFILIRVEFKNFQRFTELMTKLWVVSVVHQIFSPDLCRHKHLHAFPLSLIA